MGTFSLINPTIWVHDQDLTTFLHKISLKPTVDEFEVPTFGVGGWKARIPGRKTVEMAGEGYWDSVPDAALFAGLGISSRVITATAEGAETNTAYIFLSGLLGYEAYGNAGEPAPFVLSAKNTDSQGLIRGQMGKAKGNVAATGQLGSILTLAGPTASQYLYAAFHVFTAATTITIQIQSAAAIGFAGPTLRGTLGPITTTGGTWLVRVAGPITDGFWRFNVSAITGTFNVAGAIGVGS